MFPTSLKSHDSSLAQKFSATIQELRCNFTGNACSKLLQRGRGPFLSQPTGELLRFYKISLVGNSSSFPVLMNAKRVNLGPFEAPALATVLESTEVSGTAL